MSSRNDNSDILKPSPRFSLRQDLVAREVSNLPITSAKLCASILHGTGGDLWPAPIGYVFFMPRVYKEEIL
jgi:hypothetical protein